MRRSLNVVCIAMLVAFTVGWATPVSTDDCYAVCTYKGNSGTKYIGISNEDCDSACDKASKKCTDNDDGPCTKIKCTATNCD